MFEPLGELGYLPLWAELGSFVEAFGTEFRGSRAKLGWNDALIVGGIAAVVGLGICLLSYFLAHQDKLRRTNNPWGLFRELCKARQLDFRARTLLKRLAVQHQLEHPALVFVEAERFDLVSDNWPGPADAARLDELRRRLFSVPSPVPADPAPTS